jgi:O-acetyl-ADP-ribose deacetylase (regulator of RNase III)
LEPTQLASCYRESLRIAAERELRTIAFPSISTGIYGYPIELAASVALETVRGQVAENPGRFSEIVFCCFSQRDLEVYQTALALGST